jgi:hypothetical protein
MRQAFIGVCGLAALMLAACSSGPDIRADYDRSANFASYRTYGFVANPGTDEGGFRSLSTQLLQSAAAREMESRGYTRSDSPDLAINFKGKIEEKTDIESVPAPYYGPGWGYGGWYGAPYGGWGGSQTYTTRYNVGTLVIDVVDVKKRQVVFQGGAEGVVTKKMMENREQTINQVVGSIFSKYPFVAGQAAPVPTSDSK